MLETDGRRDGPAIVTLVEDPRTPLPCDAAHVEGGALFAILDGRPRRWEADQIYSVKFLGGGGAMLSRSRWPRPSRLTIDEARALYQRRPPSLGRPRITAVPTEGEAA